MGLFSEMKKSYNEGRQRAKAENEALRIERANKRALSRASAKSSEGVKLIEPNYGQFVTFELTDEEPLLSMVISMLYTAAEISNAKITVNGNIVKFECADALSAEAVRNAWK